MDLDPGLRMTLLALVEADERGDPMSPLRWTKSTRKLPAEQTRQGHRVSADTVANLPREEGFSQQANAKTIKGAQHPDRDVQFSYLNEQARDHRDAGDPVISVDSKKQSFMLPKALEIKSPIRAGVPTSRGRGSNSLRNTAIHRGEHTAEEDVIPCFEADIQSLQAVREAYPVDTAPVLDQGEHP